MSKISKSILVDAKAFLCWDVFHDVSIQLVPLQNAAAFYYPPKSKTHSIVLFYDATRDDFTESLFLIFHEAGHRQQYEIIGEMFEKIIEIPNGPQRQNFELEAWQLARLIFAEFVERFDFDADLLQQFDSFAQKSVNSYTDKSSSSKC